MYDMGYHRVGCIGCPLATYHQKMKEFADFPTYKEHYIKAFDEMLKVRAEQGKEQRESWADGNKVFSWWIEENARQCEGQYKLDLESMT